MIRRSVLGLAVAVLAATVLLSACGSGSKAPSSSSAWPIPDASLMSLGPAYVAIGGPLRTFTPQAGAQEGRTLLGNSIVVHVTGGSLLFVVSTIPKTAVFHCVLYALPQQRRVPIQVAVTTKYGWKTYQVRPSQPLAPGPYELRFGGSGQFGMSLYETGAR